MAKLGDLSRRRVLSLLAGVLAAPAAIRPRLQNPDSADRTVIVGGWVLRADDLEKAALNAA